MQAFRAEEWVDGYKFSRQADQENDDIQFYLGHCLENGLGGSVCDPNRARLWYERSAAQGNEKAKAALHRLAEKGEDEARKQRELEEKRKQEEEVRQRELEDLRKQLEEERKQREEEARKRRELEELRKREEEARKRREEEDRRRIAAEKEKARQPGYRFDEARQKAVWTPGLRHPSVPHIASAEKEGNWTADPGYKFKRPGRAFDGVAWTPGTPHPTYPNVVASEQEDNWRPADGYEWVDKENSWAVRRKTAASRVKAPGISLPSAWGQQEKTVLAAAVMLAAVGDRGNNVSQQDQLLVAAIAMAAMISPQSSQQEILAFKMNLLQLLQQAGPYPDISQVHDMDSERVAITREMVQSIVNDCTDLEGRLRRINSVLDAKGSRTHKTGNLGKIWQKLLSGTINFQGPIGRATPRYA